MARQCTHSQNFKSIAGLTLIGLGLNGTACQLSHFLCVIAREMLAILTLIFLAAWQTSLAFTFDHYQLLECVSQWISFWRLILTLARVV